MTRYRWVAARRAEGFPTTNACEVADVSTSSFYEWCTREAAGPTPAQQAEADLVAEIRRIHTDTDGTYRGAADDPGAAFRRPCREPQAGRSADACPRRRRGTRANSAARRSSTASSTGSTKKRHDITP